MKKYHWILQKHAIPAGSKAYKTLFSITSKLPYVKNFFRNYHLAASISLPLFHIELVQDELDRRVGREYQEWDQAFLYLYKTNYGRSWFNWWKQNMMWLYDNFLISKCLFFVKIKAREVARFDEHKRDKVWSGKDSILLMSDWWTSISLFCKLSELTIVQ